MNEGAPVLVSLFSVKITSFLFSVKKDFLSQFELLSKKILSFSEQTLHTKMKFFIKDFSSKCDQIRIFRIWSHLLEKSFMENFIFCVVKNTSILPVLCKKEKPFSLFITHKTDYSVLSLIFVIYG